MAPNPTPQANSSPRPADNKGVRTHHTAWGWIILALLILLFLSFAVWHLYQRLHARRHGLPAPSLNPFRNRSRLPTASSNTPRRSLFTWVSDKLNLGASSGGNGYTGAGVRRNRRGFGALDPDEAWDSRVGTEADYGYSGTYGEDVELGTAGQQSGVVGGGGLPGYEGPRGYGPQGGLEEIEGAREGRGRARAAKEDLEDRYEEEMQGGAGRKGVVQNPFGDEAEPSQLRGVSPRPHVVDDDSPTERRSMFREDV